MPAKKFNITKEWLEKRYVVELARVEEIAAEVGCGVPNIKRLLKKWKLRRGKALQRNGLTLVWNKGLTKESDERLAKISKDRAGDGNPMAGSVPWNKGLTKETDERVAATAVAITGLSPSEETRRKMAEAKIGLRDESTNRWAGGVSFVNQYVSISANGEKVYKHRLVAQSSLGRELLPNEQVHHIDKNPKNNSPENLLVLMADDHTRLHSAMRANPELDQRAWLLCNGINFESVKDEDQIIKAA